MELLQLSSLERASQSLDLFNGLAGWGMTQLRFFLVTGDEIYRHHAESAAERLLALRIGSPRGATWKWTGREQIGLGHGAAGVALFLLYASLATDREDFRQVGEQALAYDLSYGRELGGLITWKRFTESSSAVYPYWRYGSGGIGCVVARYYAAFHDPLYLEFLHKIRADVDRKYAVHTGLFSGLAGVGNSLLDMYLFTRDESFRESAERVASGVKLFSIETGDGIAFLGEGGVRICCDYATGGAGIAVFLNRLARLEATSPMMLDELIGASAC